MGPGTWDFEAVIRRLAENRIREAIEAGEFDHLPGKGKPIDLEEYFRTPQELRMAYSILKSANCRPEEVELLNELAELDRLPPASGPDEGRARDRRRRDLRLRLDILLERKRKPR